MVPGQHYFTVFQGLSSFELLCHSACEKQTVLCFLQSTVHIFHFYPQALLIILNSNCKKVSLILRLSLIVSFDKTRLR